MQGAAVMVRMKVSRWRCLNRKCERRTFADQLAEVVCPHARRTGESQNLFIFSDTERAAGREKG
jgi:hypothetical protein